MHDIWVSVKFNRNVPKRIKDEIFFRDLHSTRNPKYAEQKFH